MSAYQLLACLADRGYSHSCSDVTSVSEESVEAALLSDAELLLGLSRHLGTYQTSTAHAALDNLILAGEICEISWRLRSSGRSPWGRVQAIALDAYIPSRRLEKEIILTMEQLHWVECRRSPEGEIQAIEEFIPLDEEISRETDRLLTHLMASPIERATLELIRSTTRQPLTEGAALESAQQFGEQAASGALDILMRIELVRRVEVEGGRPVVFNPGIWTGDEKLSKAALKAEDARASKEIGALMEELALQPGIPQKRVKSTEKKWIDFAVHMGLVERSTIQTSSGETEGFLFSPHLQRDPFGKISADPSGHVRQMVGSMMYATTFASKYRINNPVAFLTRLVEDGTAGNVPNIATDYGMLELAGTIGVEKGTWGNAHRMKLLRHDVAEGALDVLRSQDRVSGGLPDPRSLADQRKYGHLEAERARLLQAAQPADDNQALLVAALRDAASEMEI